MSADMLHIGHEIPGGILAQFSMRRGASATALIEKDDTIFLGIVQTTHGRRDAAAGTAMNYDNGFAIRIAALFDMDAVQRRNLQHLFLEGLDFRIKRIARHKVPFRSR